MDVGRKGKGVMFDLNNSCDDQEDQYCEATGMVDMAMDVENGLLCNNDVKGNYDNVSVGTS